MIFLTLCFKWKKLFKSLRLWLAGSITGSFFSMQSWYLIIYIYIFYKLTDGSNRKTIGVLVNEFVVVNMRSFMRLKNLLHNVGKVSSHATQWKLLGVRPATAWCHRGAKLCQSRRLEFPVWGRNIRQHRNITVLFIHLLYSFSIAAWLQNLMTWSVISPEIDTFPDIFPGGHLVTSAAFGRSTWESTKGVLVFRFWIVAGIK